jgi:hypothetical protein
MINFILLYAQLQSIKIDQDAVKRIPQKIEIHSSFKEERTDIEVEMPSIISETNSNFEQAILQRNYYAARGFADKMITLLACNPKYRDWLKKNKPNDLKELLSLKNQIPVQKVYYQSNIRNRVIPVFPNKVWGSPYYNKYQTLTPVVYSVPNCGPTQCRVYTNNYIVRVPVPPKSFSPIMVRVNAAGMNQVYRK